MPALILYLLKVNVALVLFYLAYHFVLRRLTFYALNRCFLLFGIVFSTAYPFIDVSGLMSQHQDLASVYISTVPAWVTAPAIPEQTPAFDYWQIPVFLFWLGTGAMAIRLLLQFISLYKIHAASEPTPYRGIGFRQVNNITQAFSFWQAIYLNPTQHKATELESILRHELVHVKGWHTLDVLLAELNTVFYWFNPGAWLLKKAIKENLEFIADQKVICAGADRKAYQYLLLKVVGAPEPQIANQFNFPSLKRRIAMMNKKKSSLLHVARYAVLVPLIAAPILLIACSEEEADMTSPSSTATTAAEQGSQQSNTLDAAAIYYIDGEETTNEAVEKLDPEAIHTVNVVKGESATNVFGDKAANGVIAVTTKENQNSPQVLQFNQKLSAISLSPVRQDQDESFIFIPDTEDYYKNNLPEDYRAFLKRNPEVKQLGWISGIANGSAQSLIVIEFKDGGSEINSVSSAEAKYGKLPTLPPPPPPVITEEVVIPDIVVYTHDASTAPEDYKAFLKRNPEVRQISWESNEQQDGIKSVVIHLKTGGSEVYDFNDKQSMATAENKYGTLPLLPPPPPVRIDDK